MFGFGGSRKPPLNEREVAQAVLAYLEDRRALYDPLFLEYPAHVVESVLDIRRTLTNEAMKLKPTSDLRGIIDAMRAACRDFLGDPAVRPLGRSFGRPGSLHPEFGQALAQLRHVMRIRMHGLSAKYDIDWNNPVDEASRKLKKMIDKGPLPGALEVFRSDQDEPRG